MNCYMVLSFRAKQEGKAQARERGERAAWICAGLWQGLFAE